MDENVSATIPSSMRPSKSLVAHVKSTLSNLVSSVFKKTTVEKQSINERGDAQGSADVRSEEPKTCESPKSPNSFSNGVTATDAEKTTNSPASKSQRMRTKEAFQERLKSFKLSWWCGKPLSLSPPLLAQYGWECVGESMAQCCVCGAIITVHLPWPNATNYHEVCRKAQQKILRGHKKICSWPNNPASHSYLNPFNEDYLSTDEKERLKADFIERAIRLHQLQSNLPHITLEILEEMNLDQLALSELAKMCEFPSLFSSHNEEESISELAMQSSSLTLAMCGWDADPSIQLSCIQCPDTGRTVGLWNFYSVSPDENEPLCSSLKRRKIDEVETSSLEIMKSWFHPVSQHHVWSPWIMSLHSTSELLDDSSASPVRSGIKPGWQVLREILLGSDSSCTEERSKNSSPKVRTPPRVAVLQARRMLKDWSPRE